MTAPEKPQGSGALCDGYGQRKGLTPQEATVSKTQPHATPRNGLDLAGKHALITGGGTGLGRCMTEALAEAGARVSICGRREGPLRKVRDALTAAGRDAHYIVADVTSDADRRRLQAETGDVDILVNNAALGERKTWLEVSIEEWRAILTLNLEAPFALSQLFAPPMVARKWGRLINVSSIYGLIVGDPSLYGEWGVDLASYVASKHGLIGLTKHLAMVLGGTGVTVNALCPGMFPNTEQNADNAAGLVAGLEKRTPVKRVGNDDDLRAAIVYLASPGSSFYTGQSMVVDGGWTIW
jgi:NAD(P)-dependent dehydrogenase (short-subunit alcohol dehydrogenase family)